MTTLQTFFRAVVMLATLGIVAKAWMLYGPSVEEMQSIGQRVVEVADELMSKYRQGGGAPPVLANDPRVQTMAPMAAAVPPQGVSQPQPILLATAESERPEYAQPAVAITPMTGAPLVPPTRLIPVTAEQPPAAPPASGDAQLEAASARLTQQGVGDYRVEPWGKDGRWYRCSCDAPWIVRAYYNRHFEAVAADPATAIDQVAAEVDTWHRTQAAAQPTQ